MTSLYQLIADMSEQDWNYYAGYSQHKIQKPFISETSSKKFIEAYFRQGGKEAITLRFDMGSFGEQRADHTVSIFFLGLALFHQTVLAGKEIFNGETSDNYEFFHFIWFVTCLAHDIAFDLEKTESLLDACPDLHTLKQHLGITRDLSQCTVELIPGYLFKACEPYFKYRHSVRKSVDHGMYAGFLMYDALVKNRVLQHEHKQNEHLSWEPWLDAQYAYAAATVAIHNIWFADQSNIELYREHGLEALIGKEKISFAEAPLLYILAIVDTLDPVKAFLKQNVSLQIILNETYLAFSGGNTIVLKVTENLDLSRLSKDVKKLEDWLDVSVTCTEREISIRINT